MKRTVSMKESGLPELAAALLGKGVRVVAPARTRTLTGEHVDLRAIREPSEMALDAGLPERSMKELFLPPTEVLLRYKQHKQEVELTTVKPEAMPTAVIGVRPCDAAAAEKVDRVMSWDYKDELWMARRAATTVIGIACPGVDSSCFCTAVGLAPDSNRGSDLFLTRGTGGFRVEVVTDKGAALVDTYASLFGTDAPAATSVHVAVGKQGIDAERVRGWLDSHFEDPVWNEISFGCHGCGACASVCPSCHCFDIVDEPDGAESGVRRRNWDTCQTARFTMHASGHNPRHDQCARCRQRLTHKLAIYPKRFGEILCTGCGRCARACPAGVNIVEILGAIDRMAQQQGGAR